MDKDLLETGITLSYTVYERRQRVANNDKCLDILNIKDFVVSSKVDTSNIVQSIISVECVKTPTIVIDDSKKRLFVVFPGCESMAEWCSQFIHSYKQVIQPEKNIRVHSGLYHSLTENDSYCIIESTVMDILNDERYNGYQLLTCGHSLGGMYALLFSYLFTLSKKDIHINCLTYGSPRIGNAAFKKAIDTADSITHYRCFTKRDIVSYWPFYDYHHTGICVKIDDDNTVNISTKVKDSLFYHMIDDKVRNVCSWMFLTDHTCSHYYMRITDCELEYIIDEDSKTQ